MKIIAPQMYQLKNTLPNEGFTLLEVLISLAIMGLLFLGLGSISQQELASTRYLEEKIAAGTLASNLIEQYSLDGRPLEPEFTEGEKEMGHFIFPWRQTVTVMEDSGLAKLEIAVGPESNPISVQQLVWQPN